MRQRADKGEIELRIRRQQDQEAKLQDKKEAREQRRQQEKDKRQERTDKREEKAETRRVMLNWRQYQMNHQTFEQQGQQAFTYGSPQPAPWVPQHQHSFAPNPYPLQQAVPNSLA